MDVVDAPSGSAPSARCSSAVTLPPLKAYLFILFWICFGVSFMKMALLSTEADILEPGPCRASRNRECSSEGLA